MGNTVITGYLFVDFEDPASDVWIMLVCHMFHCEDLAVFLCASVFRPEHWVLLKTKQAMITLQEMAEHRFSSILLFCGIYLTEQGL